MLLLLVPSTAVLDEVHGLWQGGTTRAGTTRARK